MKTILILACIARLSVAVALAQERQPDSVYISGDGLSSPSLSGGGGDAEWVRGLSPTSTLSLGGRSNWVGNLWWANGTIAGANRRTHAIMSGRVSLGAGRGPDGRFPYWQYTGTLTIPVNRRAFVEGEGQYARVANATSGVLRFGGVYSASGRLTLRGSYYHVLSSAATQSVLGRADVSIARVRVFGGALTTFTGVAPEPIQTIQLVTQVSREFFGGAATPTGRSELIWSVQVVPQPGGVFSRVTATFRVPLGRSLPATGDSR
jgi:hypothetical protein